jgi:hypothetical protein
MNLRFASALMIFGLAAQSAGAADLPSRAPGLWQSTTTVTGPDGTPLANAVNVVTVSCVDALTDQKFFISGGSACDSLNISGGGDTYRIDGTCQQQGRAVKIRETLVYADAKDVQLTAHMGGGARAMVVTSQLQWQGECPDGMLPGDEGNIVNGAFNKADNINDNANQ